MTTASSIQSENLAGKRTLVSWPARALLPCRILYALVL